MEVEASAPRAERSHAGTQHRWSTLLLISPTVVLLVALVVAPCVYVIRVSLANEGPFGTIGSGWTLSNYHQMLQVTYVRILLTSLELAAENTLVCLVVGYVVAYFLAFRAGRAMPVLILLMVVPFWASFLVRMSAWMILLSPQGIIATALQKAHLVSGSVQLSPSQGAILVGLLYVFMPSAVFPIYAALRGIDISLLEAAKDLGCSSLGTHLHVVLPLGRPGIVAAGLFVFAPTLGVFVIPVLLGGGKNLIVGNLIVTLYQEFRNMPFGAAVSVVLIAIVMAGIVVSLRLIRRMGENGGGLF